MKYCSECGNKCIKSSTSFKCNTCGSTFYENPKGTTALFIINSEGHLVLARRAMEPSKGKLDCIGGFVDVGENFELAMYRELTEESGLNKEDLSELKYLGSTYDPYPWEDRIVHTVSVYFVATLKSGRDLIANDDVASYEIHKIEDVSKDDVAWDGMWKMLKKIESNL